MYLKGTPMPDTQSTSQSLVQARIPAELAQLVSQWRTQGLRIGFVPTMGALHDGHLALVREALRHADKVVVSIFVNPLQFAPTEDLDRYPRQEATDLALLAEAGAHLAYLPATEALYPQGFVSRIDMVGPALGLETDFRPQFFSGVATVVLKLFNQVRPDVAVFGEKDYQQLSVIRALVRDFDLGIEIIGHATVREADGLALSSRNAYLSEAERAIAPELHRALQDVALTVRKGEPPSLTTAADALIKAGFAKVDYIALRDAETLAEPFSDRPQRILAAVWLGKTRLIDNIAV